MDRHNYLPWSILSVALLLPIWWVAYKSAPFVELPFVIAKALPGFLENPDTWANVWASLRRVVIGLAIGLSLGVGAAFAMERSPFYEHLLGVYVTGALRTPSAIAAVMTLAIFRGSEAGLYAVVAFITFPFITISLRDGLRSADHELDQVSQIYRLGSWRHMRHVLAPFIAPYIFSALRNGHALAWKVIVVAEIFGVAKIGFGSQFERAFDYMLMVDVSLWLLVFMAIVLFVEYAVLRVIERRVFRWRDA